MYVLKDEVFGFVCVECFDLVYGIGDGVDKCYIWCLVFC